MGKLPGTLIPPDVGIDVNLDFEQESAGTDEYLAGPFRKWHIYFTSIQASTNKYRF